MQKCPKFASEVRSFVGHFDYSSRFIPSLATIAELLRQLTRKNVKFVWGEAQGKAFDELKTNCVMQTYWLILIKRAKHKLLLMQAHTAWAVFWCKTQKGLIE